MCLVSCVMCHVPRVTFHMSPVICHLSLVTNANRQQPQPHTLPLLTEALFFKVVLIGALPDLAEPPPPFF